MVALTHEEPGLVGFFVDENRDIVAYVVDSLRFASAQSVLQRHLMEDGLHLPKPYRNAAIIILPATYTFQQLSDWRDSVTINLFTIPGVVYDDLDESRDRVTIGIEADHASAQALVTSRLQGMNIPVAAVHFESAAPIIPSTIVRRIASSGTRAVVAVLDSLEEEADTLGGGQQIQRFFGGDSVEIGTLGLISDRSSAHGAVTVSHLSSRFLGLDSSQIYQGNFLSSDYYIAQEAVDPSGTRYSDASFFGLTSGLNYRRGSIQKTTDRHSGSGGAHTVPSTDSWLNMSAGETGLATGVPADKVGRTTGWTYGNVVGTCLDVEEAGTGVTLHCQGKAEYYSQPGDSGSPVFWWDAADGGIFYGVNWGFDGTYSYFGSYQGMETDLGTLNVSSGVTVGTPSVSGSLNGSDDAVLSWSAVSTSGTSATTSYKIFRQSWNANTCEWDDEQDSLATTTSTSWTDSSPLESEWSYSGTTIPDGDFYSFTEYWVKSYNAGIGGASDSVYFQGQQNSGINCSGGDTLELARFGRPSMRTPIWSVGARPHSPNLQWSEYTDIAIALAKSVLLP